MRDDLTQAEIDAAKSPRGGWARATLARWGVPWPPPKGWQKALTAKERAGKLASYAPRPVDPFARRATLIADASYSDQTRVGAWAAWFKRGPQPGELFSGVFRSSPGSSHVAEAMALANGIALAGHHGLLADVDVLMLQSDSAAALAQIVCYVDGATINEPERLAGKIKIAARPRPLDQHPAGIKAAIERIRSLTLQHRVLLECRHVKGHAAHRADAEGRHRVNQLCDQTARRLREEAERAAQIDKRSAAKARKKARRAQRAAESAGQPVPVEFDDPEAQRAFEAVYRDRPQMLKPQGVDS